MPHSKTSSVLGEGFLVANPKHERLDNGRLAPMRGLYSVSRERAKECLSASASRRLLLAGNRGHELSGLQFLRHEATGLAGARAPFRRPLPKLDRGLRIECPPRAREMLWIRRRR